MKPYYEQDGITIYHGDCREILPQCIFDVVITDPPYGVNLKQKQWGANRGHKQPLPYEDDADNIWPAISSVMTVITDRACRALIFPGTNMLQKYPKADAVGGFFSPSNPGKCAWGFQVFHPILYYGDDPFLQDGRGSRPNGMATIPRTFADSIHPCEKPLEWMLWAVTRASRLGETVVDPFAGSGTTLVAAKRTGRRAIGIEIEERYCEVAVRRLAQSVIDLSPPPTEESTQIVMDL